MSFRLLSYLFFFPQQNLDNFVCVCVCVQMFIF